MPAQRCPRCGQTKPLEEFHRETRRSNGRQVYCKACRALQATARKDAYASFRAANRGKLAAAAMSRYQQKRARIIALKLTLTCADCGWQPTTPAETKRLHFDHRDPDTKHTTSWTRGAYAISWPWERIEAELTLCEPRCRPCHMKRTTQETHNLRRKETS